MAVCPKTQYLIASYAREIKQDKQQREDIQKTLDGVKIFSGDHNNELVTVIEGCDEMIDRYQPAVEGLDDKIISLYAKGMSVSDIKIQMQELYGAEISESLISRITDDVIDEVKL